MKRQAGSDVNYDLLQFKIASLPGLGVLFQCEDGRRGAGISEPNTIVTDSEHRVIFFPAVNGYGSPYASFGRIASDGQLESRPAVVTVTILPPVAPTITSCGINTNGTFQLIFQGGTNTTYCVWASPDLETWEYFGPAAATAPGEFVFLDNSGAGMSERFYRLSTECVSGALSAP